MPRVTDFRCFDEDGFPILCHAFGNNVAFRCTGCGGPVLAIMRENQRGSAADHPTMCPACDSQFWVARDEEEERLVVHRMLPDV
jgi:uncharacterized protein with PIN domain